MAIRKIRKHLLEMLLALGRSQHPREFLAVLREKEGVLEELELVPGTIHGETSALFSPGNLPLDPKRAGSAHSHPNGVLMPSRADLTYFPSMGSRHLIIGYPYTEDAWQCFAADGTPVELEVVA